MKWFFGPRNMGSLQASMHIERDARKDNEEIEFE